MSTAAQQVTNINCSNVQGSGEVIIETSRMASPPQA
jgi:hypothetical protein